MGCVLLAMLSSRWTNTQKVVAFFFVSRFSFFFFFFSVACLWSTQNLARDAKGVFLYLCAFLVVWCSEFHDMAFASLLGGGGWGGGK